MVGCVMTVILQHLRGDKTRVAQTFPRCKQWTFSVLHTVMSATMHKLTGIAERDVVDDERNTANRSRGSGKVSPSRKSNLVNRRISLWRELFDRSRSKRVWFTPVLFNSVPRMLLFTLEFRNFSRNIQNFSPDFITRIYFFQRRHFF